jgi:UDP-N-acetylmuramyl-tripeptide synthetase
LKLIEKRVGLLFATFALAFLVIMFRAAWLQAVRGGEFSADARSQQVATVDVPGIRGAILDRHGDALAVSEEAATVFATPYQVEDPPKTAHKLAGLLDVPEDDLLATLTKPSGFEYVAHQIDLVTAEKIRKLDLPGIGLLPDSRRLYPQGDAGGRLIGAIGSEGQGLFGIEASKDDVLGGTDGQVAVTKDALGQEIGRDVTTGALAGHDVELTVDARIQSYTQKVLDEIGSKYQPEGATAIAMNPDDGDVLAMASWPPVDPTDLTKTDPDQLSNMATGFTYEPGSTFKAFTVAGALEEGLVTPDTTFDLPPSIQVADRTIEESHEVGYGSLTVSQILAYSSNVGAVKIGLELGKHDFDDWVHRFGFGTPTGIDYPAEEQGIVPTVDEYSGSSIGNLPIGQGLSVTPMQMMEGYAAIANGGILRTPRLVKSVDGQPVAEAAGHQVISEQTSAQLRQMLEGVLSEGGTASEVSVPGYVLAGKTGTAQKVVDGTYSDTQYVASFVGFAPAADPKLLVAVIVDDPKGGDYYGGSVAAPAFGQIASFAALPRDRPDAVGARHPAPACTLPRIAAMTLADLTAGLPGEIRRGDGSEEVLDIAFDSSAVVEGSLFVCVVGMTADGHDFAQAAVAAGAAALVVERELELDVPQYLVADSRRAMAPLAARLFGDPSSELRLVGVTGTNGKTTSAFLIRTILEAAGMSCGLLGTVRQIVGGAVEAVERTTPEAIDLQRTLRRMLDGGDAACVMEVSSHALSLGRADGLHFDVAAFTNLTQDHLDFHSDMDDYFAAKRILFVPSGEGADGPEHAVVNVDDDYGSRLAAELEGLGAAVITISPSGGQADLVARDVDFDATGSRFRLEAGERSLLVALPLPGQFNVENALVALASASGLGLDLDAAVAALAEAEPVPGRMEPIDEGQGFGVLVDYAHTPDSLVNVLRAARELTAGRLICVFGCGGDRDPSKRPLMGRAVGEGADLPVLTSDNPRSEDPEAIIAATLAGVPERERDRVLVDPDRRAAIAAAIAAAEPGDLVVVAGKGHEQGQEFEGGRKIPFDDREVAREALREIGSGAVSA